MQRTKTFFTHTERLRSDRHRSSPHQSKRVSQKHRYVHAYTCRCRSVYSYKNLPAHVYLTTGGIAPILLPRLPTLLPIHIDRQIQRRKGDKSRQTQMDIIDMGVRPTYLSTWGISVNECPYTIHGDTHRGVYTVCVWLYGCAIGADRLAVSSTCIVRSFCRSCCCIC